MAAADMLDAASPPADPAACAADARAAGARVVGLYAVNLSDPWTVVSLDYARGVAAAGVQVLPIITPGQSPPDAAAVASGLEGWEGLNSSALFGLDIEQPGIDTPPEWWVSDLLNTLTPTGWRMFEYTNLRSLYPYGFWWAIDWDHGSAAAIPPGAGGVQFSPAWTGPSGAQYDPSWLVPGMMPAAQPQAASPFLSGLSDAQQTEMYDKLCALWAEGHGTGYVGAHGHNASDLVARIAAQLEVIEAAMVSPGYVERWGRDAGDLVAEVRGRVAQLAGAGEVS